MPSDEAELIHATCIAIDGAGVLLRGPSGAGKSDLALRLIDRGAVLVGDDYVRIFESDGVLWARVPERIAGRIEVRGVGIVAMPYRSDAPVELIVDLGEEQRLPEPEHVIIAGVSLPIARLNPFPASAPIKVELLLSQCKERP